MATPLPDYALRVRRAQRLLATVPLLLALAALAGVGLARVGVPGPLLILLDGCVLVVAAHAVVLWPAPRFGRRAHAADVSPTP